MPNAWRASASASAICPRRGALPGNPPARPADDIYGVLPENHRLPYDIEEVIFRIFDAGDYTEFQPEYAPEMLCANARLSGHPVAIIANRRGFLRSEGRPRIGGIVYTESARKVAYFVELNERLGYPLIYLQDVSGFMVGPEAEREGIIRAGADMVEAMSCTTRAENHPDAEPRQRRRLLRHGGPGLRAEFHIQLADRAHRSDGRRFRRASALLVELEKLKAAGEPLPKQLQAAIDKTKTDYENWLDARYAAARGHCDAVIDPLDSRQILTMALEVTLHRPRGQQLVLETL
jgi:3-methylcrotonyl-CoA carboxylase beta subunit